MTFDIYSLENSEGDWDKDLEAYTEKLYELFVNSPEGKAHLEKYQELGGWSAQLVHLGFVYQEVTLPEMDASDLEKILFHLFPRKISLMSPNDIDDTIPELMAFWKYLQREYELPWAEEILEFLEGLDVAKFKAEMNNPANFGLARTFVQSGIKAGFDMTSQEGMEAFQQFYNASLKTDAPISLALSDEIKEDFLTSADSPQRSSAKEKRRKKLAKNSRKRNRKKRK